MLIKKHVCVYAWVSQTAVHKYVIEKVNKTVQ